MFKVTIEFKTQAELIEFFSTKSATPVVVGQLGAAEVDTKVVSVKASEVRAERDASNSTMAAAKKAVEAKKSAAAPTAQATTPAPAALSTAAAEPTVDYATLQKAVFALANASREAAVEVMTVFNVKSFKELLQDQWAPALTAVNLKLESLQAK